MPFAELSTGATLHYLDTDPTGTEPPVILVHGFLGTPETELPGVIAWLRADYRVIGPTLRGYGQSTPKPRKFPYTFYHIDAGDVVALMDRLNIETAHLMGYSDGGEVALLAAAHHPARFRSVVVWGATGYFGPLVRPAAQRMFPATWMTPEQQETHGIEHPDAFILDWVKAIRTIVDSGGDLSLSLAHRINAPLLMLLGTQDSLNPVEYGQTFVDRTPNGRLATFDCGHAVHDEVPEEFKRVVGEFLAGTST
jgi:valacyclovir hydrolase